MRIERAMALAILLGGWLAACASQPPNGPQTQLEATLISPIDIALTWQTREPDAAGRVVEYATEPDGLYTILQFVPPDQTTFTHPDLMPETPFYYRVRSFHGPASAWVKISLPDGPLAEEAERDDHEWAAPRVLPGAPAATASIRTAGTAAAPTDLTATIKHANGIAFTWTDHATDEDGYLIEVQPQGSANFRVAAVVDPNVNSYGLITLPDEKIADYRVRAFHYGQPSNLAHQRTGPAAN